MLSIESISYAYNKTNVIDTLSFTAKKGAHITLMGESGCGKSTLLKAIYGLLSLPKGKIVYNNKELLGPEHHLVPGHPFMKYLAQEFDLMPFISAADNVGEFLSNFYPNQKQQRTKELLEIVGMTAHAKTHVRFLSGGQKQRVALARVLAKEPEVLLLDEPFSQIDNFKKNELRYRLFSYLKKQNITCITATHDKNDALAFSDNIIVIKQGKQISARSPQEMFANPTDQYSASLLSEINIVPLTFFDPAREEKNILLYPHEIKLKKDSPTQLEVVAAYYNGTHYLIKAELHNKSVLFHHDSYIAPKTLVGITVSRTIIEQRARI
ncbi:ABC transporter ATP-binding protein [Aquimarina agarilytica]|uniref:ABC transporter ATP-binding protein n=1 Tax=Aquimarina agarilytica TaxID=1087449 RepID=UPI0002892D76|nr:ABC transporter ATP-binding protein [Aquimarina agarilytica]